MKNVRRRWHITIILMMRETRNEEQIYLNSGKLRKGVYIRSSGEVVRRLMRSIRRMICSGTWCLTRRRRRQGLIRGRSRGKTANSRALKISNDDAIILVGASGIPLGSRTTLLRTHRCSALYAGSAASAGGDDCRDAWW